MRKLTLIALLVFVLAACSLAAEIPKFEVFGGYSLLHMNTNLPKADFGTDSIDPSGWRGSFTYNVNRYIGLTAEVGGQYNSSTFSPLIPEPPIGAPTAPLAAPLVPSGDVVHDSTRIHTFLFGPKFTKRGKKLSPYAQVLFGLAHGAMNASVNGGPSTELLSDDTLGISFGVGLDAHFTRRLSLRVGQLDLLHTGFDFRPVAGLAGLPENTTINASSSQNNLRFSTGMVFNFGAK
ncbi:MAG: outer membrane beta-barrel protein [Terriglobales bacterium]